MSDASSRHLWQRACRVLVGGVNSPVRAFKGVGGTPRFIVAGRGAHVRDADGQELIDYVASWGALLFGHAPDFLLEPLEACARSGTSFGFPTELEVQLAELVTQLVPYVEKVRFVSSGTEATSAAVRLARGATGRSKIVKCAGCYHGAVDSLLVTAGSGIATLGVPETVGVPDAIAAETLVVPYNDLEALEHVFHSHGPRIAAFILEPIAGNMGLVPPEPGYLEAARQLTRGHGALLVFDEVMTGFRVAAGGAAELYGVTPDLVTFGKIIGGGVPCGAVAGPADVMDHLAPLGNVYQAGTLAGNPLAMRAGLATLGEIQRRGRSLYEDLEARSATLSRGLEQLLAAHRVPARVQRVGSMLTVFFQENPVRNYAEAKRSDTNRFAAFFHAMLREGVHLPPSQFECWFLTAAHDNDVIEETLRACERALAQLVG